MYIDKEYRVLIKDKYGIRVISILAKSQEDADNKSQKSFEVFSII